MAAAQDVGDVEMLGILAALGVAVYIAYSIYEGYQQDKSDINNSPAGQAASAVGQAAESFASGSILTDNPIVNWFKEAGTAISDPFGDSLITGSNDQ